MKVTLITADSAQRDSAGKVHALGLNWTWLAIPTPPVAVVVILDPDMDDELTTPVELVVELVDSTDEPVLLGESKEPLKALIKVTAEQPATRMMLAFNVGQNMPIGPGGYSWRAVDQNGKEYARVGFEVRSPEGVGDSNVR